jgi:hypothetical protein
MESRRHTVLRASPLSASDLVLKIGRSSLPDTEEVNNSTLNPKL